MTRTLERPILPVATARVALEATKHDVLLHAGASLMLLAGLRPTEVTGLLVRDWEPGEDPGLTVRERTIRVAPSAAATVSRYLAGQDAEPDEPLLLGLKIDGAPHVLHRVFRDAMRAAYLDVGVHDLRRAAVAVVLDDGTPMQHVEAYFGLSKTEARTDLAPLREGYDVGIAAALEAAFAG